MLFTVSITAQTTTRHSPTPQDIRNCVNCHVDTGTVGDRTDLVVTAQGDNWAEVPTSDACGSCHDDVDFDTHKGGQPDDSRCGSCHASDKTYGAINAHRMLAQEARDTLFAEVMSVSNSSPGETPTVRFRVSNPETGESYDILNDPIFTGPGARLAVGLSWNTDDYTNFGNGEENASQVQVEALASAIPAGDGSFAVTFDAPIPASDFASGSGIATLEGHPVFDLGETDSEGEPVLSEVPVGDAHQFFSINEPDGQAVARRNADDVADETLALCHNCHATLELHGQNRADNLDSCVSCHNPRNTDRIVRDLPGCEPPSDGKSEESIDFKTMIHGIHAAAMREEPLQIVGFSVLQHPYLMTRSTCITRATWQIAPPVIPATVMRCHWQTRYWAPRWIQVRMPHCPRNTR